MLMQIGGGGGMSISFQPRETELYAVRLGTSFVSLKTLGFPSFELGHHSTNIGFDNFNSNSA